jgi:hypothetical protein
VAKVDMVSPEKMSLLQAFLGSLPEHLAERLAEAVEIDRMMHGKILPHDSILEALRPALRRAERPRRVLTPLRLFCQPFEDLLTSEPRTAKQKGRISRTTIVPLWTWLTETLAPQESTAYTGRASELIGRGRVDEAIDVAVAYAAAVAPMLRAALTGEIATKKARAVLNGDAAVADAEEIAILIACGSEIIGLQKMFPRPFSGINDEMLWSARAIYDRVNEVAADAAPYIPVILMSRLARPWEALRLPMMIARQTQDTLISSTDMGLAGELLFGDLDRLSSAIRATKHPGFDADKLISDIGHFAEISSAVVKEIDVRRDGKWGQGLLKDRAEVGNVMSGLMERAPKEIANALPTRKLGNFASTRVPDFSRSVAPEKVDIAQRYARLIAGCRPFAAAASFAAKLKDAEEEAMLLLRTYNEDVVKELRAGEASRRAVVEEQFGLAVELTAALFSEEDADLLRRRGRAAVSNVAAA